MMIEPNMLQHLKQRGRVAYSAHIKNLEKIPLYWSHYGGWKSTNYHKNQNHKLGVSYISPSNASSNLIDSSISASRLLFLSTVHPRRAQITSFGFLADILATILAPYLFFYNIVAGNLWVYRSDDEKRDCDDEEPYKLVHERSPRPYDGTIIQCLLDRIVVPRMSLSAP